MRPITYLIFPFIFVPKKKKANRIIFAQGFIGGGLAMALKRVLPGLAIEGVEYAAESAGNYTPEGASADGISYATKLLTTAATQCPRAAIIASGFSQGAALMHRAIEALPRAVQDRIAAVVLFGDSSNTRDHGRVSGFPLDRTMIFCRADDPVCSARDLVTEAHVSYGGDVVLGADWAAAKVLAFLKRRLSG